MPGGLVAKQMKERGIRPLFQYECGAATKDRYVSCMDWNVANPDLLAVSYGELEHPVRLEGCKQDGLLLFWTLKNPKFPERTIKTKSRIFLWDPRRCHRLRVLQAQSQPHRHRGLRRRHRHLRSTSRRQRSTSRPLEE